MLKRGFGVGAILRAWLRDQTERDDAVGRLAREVRDKGVRVTLDEEGFRAAWRELRAGGR